MSPSLLHLFLFRNLRIQSIVDSFHNINNSSDCHNRVRGRGLHSNASRGFQYLPSSYRCKKPQYRVCHDCSDEDHLSGNICYHRTFFKEWKIWDSINNINKLAWKEMIAKDLLASYDAEYSASLVFICTTRFGTGSAPKHIFRSGQGPAKLQTYYCSGISILLLTKDVPNQP